MTKYIDQELARYCPVSAELMEQYRDGSHTVKNIAGSLIWRNKNVQVHRDGDKPAIISRDGTLEWWQNDERCRDGDKPAIIFPDGGLQWWQNGKRHRFCGPAVIYQDDTLEWVIYDKNITKEVNEWLDGEEWRGTPEQIVEFQLRFL